MLKYTELPYLWFFYRCLAEAKEHGWPMIAQEGYLRRPGELAAKGVTLIDTKEGTTYQIG